MKTRKRSATWRAHAEQPDYHVEVGAADRIGDCQFCGRPYRGAPSWLAGITVQRFGSALCRYQARVRDQTEGRRLLAARRPPAVRPA